MTNSANIEGLSQEAIDLMVANPGQTISGGKISTAEVITATRSVDISEPARKGIRPGIRGNENTDHTGERITVSSNLAKKLADGDAKMRAIAAKQHAAEQAQAAAVEETSADKVLARLNYLERTVKAQAKQIKELQK